MKHLQISLKFQLPDGRTIDLHDYSVELSGLEQLAIDSILAMSGGKLDVSAEVEVRAL